MTVACVYYRHYRGFLSVKTSLFFVLEKLAEAQRRFATLQNELQSSLDAQRESWANERSLRRRKTVFALSQQERCKHRNIKDLQLAFSEFYLSLILLQNYQVHVHTFTFKVRSRIRSVQLLVLFFLLCTSNKKQPSVAWGESTAVPLVTPCPLLQHVASL